LGQRPHKVSCHYRREEEEEEEEEEEKEKDEEKEEWRNASKPLSFFERKQH